MKQRSEMLPHIPELDGVRGIAVLMVMVMHFYDPVAQAAPLGWLGSVIGHGGAGVDLFFVLSGFLITGILVSTKSALNYFRAFYGRRSVRIFPLYFAVAGLFFFVAAPLLHRHGKDMLMRSGEQIWYWAFLENWRHALGYSDGAQLAHFWSLAIEEQFYLAWSLLVWFTSVRTLRRVTLLLIVAVAVGREMALAHGVSSTFVYFSTITRMDALAFGALVAVNERARVFLSRFAFVILPVCLAALVVGLPGGLPYLISAAASATLVALAATRAVPLLRMRWLRDFGKYSYGMYVIHYLVHGALAPAATHMRPLPFVFVSISCGIAVSYALARLSWAVLESPFLRLKKNFRYRFAESASEAQPRPA